MPTPSFPHNHDSGYKLLFSHPAREVRNLAEALFRLEQSRKPEDIIQVLQALGSVLQGGDAQQLRRTVNIWVRKLLRRKVPKANIDEIDAITDLLEGHAMLEQTIERWFEEATEKGMQQGMQQGMEQGRQEGRLEGLARAIALQVQMRFGSPPPWVDARLQSATQDELVGWAVGILTAASVQELFGRVGGEHS